MRGGDGISLSKISAWLNSYTVFIFQNAGGLLITAFFDIKISFIINCSFQDYILNTKFGDFQLPFHRLLTMVKYDPRAELQMNLLPEKHHKHNT